MQFRENRSRSRRFENSLKSSCDTESASPLLLRAKARERAAAVHGSSTGGAAEMRQDGNSIVASALRTVAPHGAEVHRTAVACENRVGVRQCASISPPALLLHYREMFNREIRFVHTRANAQTRGRDA